MPFSVKRIRLLRRLLLGLACIVTLSLAIRFFEDWRSRQNWTRFVAEQERLGTPVTQFPSKVHPGRENNFFETPAIQDLLFGTGHTDGKKSLRKLSVLNVRQRSSETLEDLVERLPPLPEELQPTGGSASLTAAEQILLHFTSWETEFSALRSAAHSRTESLLVYPEPITSKNGIQQLDKISLDDAMMFSRVLATHAQASLAAGRIDDSFEDILVLFRFGAGFCRSPNTMLEFLVGSAITNEALGPWKSGLNQRAWTTGQLTSVQNQLSNSDGAYADARSALAVCILMERNLAALVLSQESSWTEDETARPLWIPVSAKTWLRSNVFHAVKGLEKTRALLDDRSTKGLRETVHAIQQHELEIKRSSSPYGTLAKISVPNIAEISVVIFQKEAERRMTSVVCALERYYTASGAYPDSLTLLAPAYITTVPTDPITDDSLHYRKNSDGTFALYSVGIDGDDDSGIPLKSHNEFEPDGDWAW